MVTPQRVQLQVVTSVGVHQLEFYPIFLIFGGKSQACQRKPRAVWEEANKKEAASKVNNTATSSSLAPSAASFSAQPPAAGIAPSLSHLGLSYSNGHRLKNGGGVEMSTAASGRSLGLGPVLVASQCSVNDIDMTDGSVSIGEGANGLSSMACRQFSGIKRKRDNAAAQQLALVGDDADMSAEWAAAVPNGYNHLQVDLDLQPEKQKRMCSESHHSVFYSHHHPHQFTSLPGHNHLLSSNIHDNAHYPATINQLHPHIVSDHSILNGVDHSSRNTFAHQKLNLCTGGMSVLEEEAGSCMHIHVPGVSVTECPRCLAGEPVYAINAGTYGTLQSIFEHPHSNNGHELMTTSTD